MIWGLVITCWLVSFLFAGIEAGLLALDPVRLRTRAKNGDAAALRKSTDPYIQNFLS